MWDPKNETSEGLHQILDRRPLDRMEQAYQDAARQELDRRAKAVLTNLDLAAPCPTCLAKIADPCQFEDGGNGVHTDRSRVAKVMHLLPKIKHLL